MSSRQSTKSVLPGFSLTMGYTVLYLSLLVLLPLAALVIKSTSLGWDGFWASAWNPRVVAAYKLTFGASLVAATINAVFGFVVAWTLVRYTIPGKKFVDAMVDLPFALPTAVSGIALTAVYSQNGWIGQYLEPLGSRRLFHRWGSSLPSPSSDCRFVVRTLQPAIEEIDRETEEAAASLGASRLQSFRRVILPAVMPALLTGFALSFARALVNTAPWSSLPGNMPMKTEIASLLIITKLEQYDYAGATAIATMMLAASFVMLLSINTLQWWSGRRLRGVA